MAKKRRKSSPYKNTKALKERLTKSFEYSSVKPRLLEDKEVIMWGDFKKEIGNKLEYKNAVRLTEMYNSVFGLSVDVPCLNCSPAPFLKMIKKIDIVYKVHKSV